jgi:aryl-alcohol dehydrogenase-like predicted oxidoreductase
VWQQPGVSTVIPGARNAEQARSNAAAGAVPSLGAEVMEGVRRIYDTRLREAIHSRW